MAETSDVVVKGRYYPEMPPALPGETDEQYTDRLTGADKTDRRPYDHRRFRQCSVGWHDECSDPAGDECECPCHTEAEPKISDERSAIQEARRFLADVKQRYLNDAEFHARVEMAVGVVRQTYAEEDEGLVAGIAAVGLAMADQPLYDEHGNMLPMELR